MVVYEDLKVSNMVKNHHRSQQCFLEVPSRKAASAKSITHASWYQFTQWLDYYGKIWAQAVVAVSANYTSQDCFSGGARVKKSLSTRTHSCSSCGVEICRVCIAAINILKKGMKVLGMEWNNSTEGQKESASIEGKHGEKTTSTIDGQLDNQ